MVLEKTLESPLDTKEIKPVTIVLISNIKILKLSPRIPSTRLFFFSLYVALEFLDEELSVLLKKDTQFFPSK